MNKSFLNFILIILTLLYTISSSTVKQSSSYDPYFLGQGKVVSQGFDENIEVEVNVPEEQLPQVNEYSFAFWFRFSYIKPKRIYFEDLARNWFSLAGVTEKSNYCVSNEHGYRALSLWLSDTSRTCQPQYQLSTYDLNQNRANSYQNLLIDRNEFDMKWNFVYFGYSDTEKAAFAFWKTQTSQQIFTLDWKDIQHTIPPPALKFRLGNCERGRLSLNGHYFNVYFSYLRGAFLNDQNAIDRDIANSVLPQFYQNPSNYFTMFGANPIPFSANDTQPVFMQLENVTGYLEYSVFGWAKWEKPEQQRDRHFWFRFSTTPPEVAGSNNTEGDRTLAAWVGRDELIFATYNLGFDTRSTISQEFSMACNESELSQWHFVYFGYHYESKKALVYVKFQNREQVILFSDIWHMQSRYFGLSVGRDRFDSDSYNGVLKSFQMNFGGGAYREKKFYELLVLTERQVPSLQDFQFQEEIDRNEIVGSNFYGSSVLKFEAPKDQLEQTEDVSFAFWFRFNYFDPDMIFENELRDNYMLIASVSETGSCEWSETEYSNTRLLLESKPYRHGKPKYCFGTYSLDTEDKHDTDEKMYLPVDTDFDSNWIYVYYGHSHETNSLYAFMYFSRSGGFEQIKLRPSRHQHPPKQLTFNLGDCGKNADQFQLNGQYYDPRFRFRGKSYFEDPVLFMRYIGNTDRRPSQFLPPKQKIVVNIIDQQDTQPIYKEIPEAENALEYSLSGWFKITGEMNPLKIYSLFRVTDWPENIVEKNQKVGDRSLAFTYLEHKFCFITYHYGMLADSSLISIVQKLENEAEDGTWIYVNFGYNLIKQRAFAILRFSENNVKTLIWRNAVHMIPKKLYLYLGQDKFFKRPMLTQLKDWQFQIGPGSYQEWKSGFEQEEQTEQSVQKIVVEQETVIDLPPQEVSYKLDARWKENKVLEIDVPKNDLSSVDSYSFCFWAQFSYTDPIRIDLKTLRNHNLAMAGITESDNYLEGESTAAVALWFRKYTEGSNPFYTGATYDNAKQQNINQHVLIQEKDLDLSWNWIYMGYSGAQKKFFGTVYFYESSSWQQFAVDEVVHNIPPENLKFLLGRAAFNQGRQFNGFYSDVHFNYRPDPFFGSLRSVQKYFKKNLQVPAYSIPSYQKFRLVSCDQSFSQSQFKSQQIVLTNDLSGALQYDIWGWFKWVDPLPGERQKYHSLFRVTINDPSIFRNNEQLGDRTLAGFVGNNELVLTTYNYDFVSNSDKDIPKRVEMTSEEQNSWIFVYMYFSYNAKTVNAFVKVGQREVKLEWGRIWHFLPRYFAAYIGKDPYYAPFNGVMKNWFVSGGEGDGESMQDTIYKEMEATSQCFLDQQIILTKGEDSQPGTYIDVVQEPPSSSPEKEDDDTRIYGFSIWTRWSFAAQDVIDTNIYQNSLSVVARLASESANKEDIDRIENPSPENSDLKVVNSLVIYISKEGDLPAYKFAIYDSKTQQEEVSQLFPIAHKDFDGQWNYLHFTYSRSKKAATGLVYFSQSKTVLFKEWQSIEQVPAFKDLQLLVGGQFRLLPQIQGQVKNAMFLDKESDYFNQQSDFINEAESSFTIKDFQVQPELMSSILQENNQYFQKIQLAEFTTPTTEESKVTTYFEWDNDFLGAHEYAVYGWAKWSEEKQQEGVHTIFRLSINDKSELKDNVNGGDRVLALFLKENKLVFGTHTLLQQNYAVEGDLKAESEQLKQWFWIYFGYTRELQKAHFYIKWADGTSSSFILDGVLNIIPQFLAFHLGHDGSNTNNLPFYGSLKNFYLGVGNKVYAENENSVLAIHELLSEHIEEQVVEEQKLEEENTQIQNQEDEFKESEKPMEANMDDASTEPEISPFNDAALPPEEQPQPSSDNTYKESADGQPYEESYQDQETYEPKKAEQPLQEPSTEGGESIPDNEQAPSIDLGEPVEEQVLGFQPEENCGYLFTKCFFQGKRFELCKKAPEIKDFGEVKSVIVPEKKKITVYTQMNFQGLKAEFYETVDCLKTLDYRFLSKHHIRLTKYDLPNKNSKETSSKSAAAPSNDKLKKLKKNA